MRRLLLVARGSAPIAALAALACGLRAHRREARVVYGPHGVPCVRVRTRWGTRRIPVERAAEAFDALRRWGR